MTVQGNIYTACDSAITTSDSEKIAKSRYNHRLFFRCPSIALFDAALAMHKAVSLIVLTMGACVLGESTQ